MITRPMLAATYQDGDNLSFPLLATPKVDGVRALIVNGTLVSRSFRPIPNTIIKQALEDLLPEGADGEITCGSLYDTTSIVMSKHAPANNVRFSWFDWAYDLNAPYENRVSAITKHVRTHCITASYVGITIVPLVPKKMDNLQELEYFEKYALNNNFEGVVVRMPSGRYKCGRSTLKEGFMIKIKRSADYEGIIIGTEELMHNTNEEQADNFGNIKRSSAKNKLTAGDTLGALVVHSNGVTFRIGTGFTTDMRDALWANRETVVGQLAKYKSSGVGRNGLPRSPVFMGLRHLDDL